MPNFFPGAEITGNQIKIPKSALPRLEANPITAAQFFAAVLHQGDRIFPENLLLRTDYKISVIQTSAYYANPSTNRIAVLFRTEINLTATNLKDLA